MPILRVRPAPDAPVAMDTAGNGKASCVRRARKRTRSMLDAGETRAVVAPPAPRGMFFLPDTRTDTGMGGDNDNNNVGLKIMQKMGYVAGSSLGASSSSSLFSAYPYPYPSLRGRAGIGHPIYAMGKLSVDDGDHHRQEVYDSFE